MNLLKRFKAARLARRKAITAKNREVLRRKWLRENSKNYRLGRVKSACSGFGRITTYWVTGPDGRLIKRGPTHFGCGCGFPKK